jgi:hypothetical protein
VKQDAADVARLVGVSVVRVERELASAIQRSEPDAREVYGVIKGSRVVAEAVKTRSGPSRAQPWERLPA